MKIHSVNSYGNDYPIQTRKNFKAKFLIDATKIETGYQHVAMIRKIVACIEQPTKYIKCLAKYGFKKKIWVDVQQPKVNNFISSLEEAKIPFELIS